MRTARQWTCSALLLLLALCLASACASGPTSRSASYSVPAALERPTLDQQTTRSSGALVFSAPDEAEAIPRVAFTERAFALVSRHFWQVLRDRCAMRAQLQVANGGRPDPDDACTEATP